jgi:hypothetical protein
MQRFAFTSWTWIQSAGKTTPGILSASSPRKEVCNGSISEGEDREMKKEVHRKETCNSATKTVLCAKEREEREERGGKDQTGTTRPHHTKPFRSIFIQPDRLFIQSSFILNR